MTSPQPVEDYSTAAARIVALQSRDDARINPKCRTRFMTHGRKTPWAFVFWHGYTNCPQQWARFAAHFHERGHNVLIPRMPKHGRADRLSKDLAQLRGAHMCAFLDDMLDLAHGLGERVLTVGLSLGGALALRAAQTRPDLDVAVAVAPQIVPRNVPAAFVPFLIWLALRLPDFFIWWDSNRKASDAGPQHAYPRFPLHGMADMFAIAREVLGSARVPGAVPRARSALVVTAASDEALDNRPAHEIIARWRANGAPRAALYEFEASLGIIHDLIDEDQPQQKVDIVYPVLERLIIEQMAQVEAA